MTNIEFDLSKVQTKPKAVLVAVSREYGLDLIQVYNNSINQTKFKIFLEELRRKYWTDDIIIVLDNLSLHKSNNVKSLMEELGFHYTYTPVYSPQFNGIEEVINMGKQNIKKKRIEAVIKGEQIDMNQMIIESFYEVNPHYIAKAVRRSLMLLNLNNI